MKTDKKKNVDLIFIIFVLILITALITIGVIIHIYKQQIEQSEHLPSIEPSLLPSDELTDVDANEQFEYSFPRKAEVSLSQNSKWCISIGGSGSDVLNEVLCLDKMYLFGTTDSVDFDFKSSGGNDLFSAAVSYKGELLSVQNFGRSGDDIFCDVIPCYSSIGTVFLVFSKNANEGNNLYIERLSADMKSSTTKKLSFDGNVQFKKALVGDAGAIILINIDTPEGTQAVMMEIDGDCEVVSEYNLGEFYEFVDALFFNGGIIALCTNKTTDDYVEIAKLNLINDFSITKNVFSDKKRTPLFITPDENGYIVGYNYYTNGNKCYGIMHLSKSFIMDFDYEISGYNYEKITVISDYGAEKLRGYHIFATSISDVGYKTYYENVCTHGDLIDFSNNLLSDVSIEKFTEKSNGLLVLGNKIIGGKSVFSLNILNNNHFVIDEYTFGGSGSDILYGGIVSPYGELILYGTTSSIDGDVAYLFGKSDIFLIAFEE